jgi:hypothetical protein
MDATFNNLFFTFAHGGLVTGKGFEMLDGSEALRTQHRDHGADVVQHQIGAAHRAPNDRSRDRMLAEQNFWCGIALTHVRDQDRRERAAFLGEIEEREW